MTGHCCLRGRIWWVVGWRWSLQQSKQCLEQSWSNLSKEQDRSFVLRTRHSPVRQLSRWAAEFQWCLLRTWSEITEENAWPLSLHVGRWETYRTRKIRLLIINDVDSPGIFMSSLCITENFTLCYCTFTLLLIKSLWHWIQSNSTDMAAGHHQYDADKICRCSWG